MKDKDDPVLGALVRNPKVAERPSTRMRAGPLGISAGAACAAGYPPGTERQLF